MTDSYLNSTRDLQAAVKALSAMGLTYREIAQIEDCSPATIATWGKGRSDSYGAHPVWRIGNVARLIRSYMRTVIRLGRDHAPHGVGMVTVRRHPDTPDWALRLALPVAQTWLAREAVLPPLEAWQRKGLIPHPVPVIETVQPGSIPGCAEVYVKTRGNYPLGALAARAGNGSQIPGKNLIVSIPSVLLWARYRDSLPSDAAYPWRPDTTGE